MCVGISKEWYEDIKSEVRCENEFFYDRCGCQMVEVDVDENQFNEVSKKLGWMAC